MRRHLTRLFYLLFVLIVGAGAGLLAIAAAVNGERLSMLANFEGYNAKWQACRMPCTWQKRLKFNRSYYSQGILGTTLEMDGNRMKTTDTKPIYAEAE